MTKCITDAEGKIVFDFLLPIVVAFTYKCIHRPRCVWQDI